MDETPCVFCRHPVANGGGMNNWYHTETGDAQCDPTYASPDFIFPKNIRRYND